MIQPALTGLARYRLYLFWVGDLSLLILAGLPAGHCSRTSPHGGRRKATRRPGSATTESNSVADSAIGALEIP